MEAICRHRDITPTVLLHSSKDDDHSGHSEGKFIYDTESSESSTMETLDGRSSIFLIPLPYL